MIDIQTQLRILRSNTLINRVVKKFEAAPEGDSKREMAGRVAAWHRALNLSEPTVKNAREMALGVATGWLRAKAQGQTRLIEVDVENPHKNLASDFATTTSSNRTWRPVGSRRQWTGAG